MPKQPLKCNMVEEVDSSTIPSYIERLTSLFAGRRQQIEKDISIALTSAIEILDKCLTIANEKPGNLYPYSLLSEEEERRLRASVKGFCPNPFVCYLAIRPEALFIAKEKISFDGGNKYYHMDWICRTMCDNSKIINIEETAKLDFSQEILYIAQEGVEIIEKIQESLPSDSFYIVSL